MIKKRAKEKVEKLISTFVYSYYNKYVQYRLMANTFSTDGDDWQGVDEQPTVGSENLVKSGGVANKFAELEGEEDKIIDMSLIEMSRGCIYQGKWWQTSNGVYQHKVINVTAGEKYKLKTLTNASYYALLKTYVVPDTYKNPGNDQEGKVADFAVGNTEEVIPLRELEIEIPSSCNYLYIETKNSSGETVPSVIKEGKQGKIEEIENLINTVDKKSDDIADDVELAKQHIDENKQDIGNTQKDVDVINADLYGVKDTIIDMSTIDMSRGIIINGKWWQTDNGSYQHKVVPVIKGEKYKLKSIDYASYYAFLSTYIVPDVYLNPGNNQEGKAPDFTSGTEIVVPFTEIEVVIPDSCYYLYIMTKNSSQVTVPSVVKCGKDGYIKEIEELKDACENIPPTNYMKDRSIAWYGTSIPSGASYLTDVVANKNISILGDVLNKEIVIKAKGDKLPCRYPILVGNMLGASAVYNESVGGSKACKNTSGSNLESRFNTLGNSVKEICDVMFGDGTKKGVYSYSISSKTFTFNSDNGYGVTTVPSLSAWSSFVNKLQIYLQQSYEISLVMRYLISDQTQRNSYLQSIFGNHYNAVYSLFESNGNTFGGMCKYDNVDMFVFEHSVNDIRQAFTGDVTSTDMTTFEGAYNTFISLIKMYKPSARIVFVDNYISFEGKSGDVTYNNDVKFEKIKALAHYHNIPYIDMRDFSQTSYVQLLTQGYWEVTSDSNLAIWHDSGFTWNPSTGDTNCKFKRGWSGSKDDVIATYRPQQINGVWYWQTTCLNTMCFDNTHPHSDKTCRLTKIIARKLSDWMKSL